MRLNLVRHILKAYYESYSKIIRGHKYKDKDNEKDNDKDKDTDKVAENTTYAKFLQLTNNGQLDIISR